MLKKMRWRFIGAAMGAFSAVILILLCFVNLWNYGSVLRQLDDTLERLSEVEIQDAPSSRAPQLPFFEDWPQYSTEVQYSLRFFSVRFDAGGEVEAVQQDFIASLSREDAVSYAQAVAESGKKSGFSHGYRYLTLSDTDGTTVLFLNAEREIRNVQSLLWITLVIAAVCLIAVLGLVMLLSRRAIQPYLKNLEAQKQFITNAGHELKTPLTAISTSADVLAMEHEGDEWVESIRAQSARLSRLITSLVTLSRLDEENPFPDRSAFSLSDAVWEAAEPFVPVARGKGLDFHEQLEDGLSENGDQAALQQTISILLDNAVKYCSPGGRIELTLRRCGKKNELLVFNTCRTEDLPADLSRLFDRFYRGDPSHSSRSEGTGIGLSIARATVAAHGGSIRAERVPEGISFRLLL